MSATSVRVRLQLISVLGATLHLLVLLANSAPTPATQATSATSSAGAAEPLRQPVVPSAAESSETIAAAPKSKRELPLKTIEQLELESQETGYLPAAYKTDSDYGYDSGKNAYGKQASDWSLYDQGRLCNLYAA